VARPRVNEEHREAPVWLDYARCAHRPGLPSIERDQVDFDQRVAELRRAVLRWVILADPVLDPVIYADLAPDDPELSALWQEYVSRPEGPKRPAVRPLSQEWRESLSLAHALSRDVTDFLSRHKATYHFQFDYDGEAGLGVRFQYNDGIEEAWDIFLDQVRAPDEPLGFRACLYCGRAFRPQRDTAQYCSDSCRVQAYKRRKQEAGS
jgi:hypothetical protein